MNIDLDKLEGLFSQRYRELVANAKNEEFFVDWCSEHGIVLMHNSWVRETFNGPRDNFICIWSPEEGENDPAWLLVPEKFAERALVLGGLP